MLHKSLSRRIQRGAVAATAMASFVLLANEASAQFSGLYFFGDSFTDIGNASGLAAQNGLGNPTPPPYAPGRFSNDKIWAELFASRLGRPADATSAWVGTGNNYAVGGATTGYNGALGTPTGMLSQAALFAKQHPDPTKLSSGGLFVLWGGGNDVTDAVALTDAAARAVAITTAVTNISTFAGYLATAYGAKNFLIPLLPNAGLAPLYASDPASAAIATALTNSFNGQLGAAIQNLGAFPGVNAWGLSLNNLVTNIQIDAAAGGKQFGITNTKVPCFLLPNPPALCGSSLFVDDRHPTSTVEFLIANSAYDRVISNRDISVVPEPSTVLLTGAGLGIVAMAVKKRKKF